LERETEFFGAARNKQLFCCCIQPNISKRKVQSGLVFNGTSRGKRIHPYAHDAVQAESCGTW
jgi:hypothetical protein